MGGAAPRGKRGWIGALRHIGLTAIATVVLGNGRWDEGGHVAVVLGLAMLILVLIGVVIVRRGWAVVVHVRRGIRRGMAIAVTST